jgi:hypothetical protein
MFVTLRYDFPISDFDVIPANTKLELIEGWDDYTGFVAVRYRQGSIYLNSLYLEPIHSLVSL